MCNWLQSWTKVLGHLHFFAENSPSSISPSPSPSQCCISGLKVHFFGATLTRGEGGRHFAQTRPSRASKTERLANTCHIFRLSQGLLSRIVDSNNHSFSLHATCMHSVMLSFFHLLDVVYWRGRVVFSGTRLPRSSTSVDLPSLVWQLRTVRCCHDRCMWWTAEHSRANSRSSTPAISQSRSRQQVELSNPVKNSQSRWYAIKGRLLAILSPHPTPVDLVHWKFAPSPPHPGKPHATETLLPTYPCWSEVF